MVRLILVDWQVIEGDLEALLSDAGYELVELQRVMGRGARLALLVDRADEPGHITLDECAAISRKVSGYLDVADPFRGPFHLLVSSPGVDRPLCRPSHYQRAVGQRVRLRYDSGEGPVTVLGMLRAVGDDGVTLDLDGRTLEVPWPRVEKANVAFDWGD
jgi:ribosome maturation factor RimP